MKAQHGEEVPPLNALRYADGVFAVGPEHGFLPQEHPSPRLPEGPAWDQVQHVVDAMPIWQRDDGSKTGLLAEPGAIVAAVEQLPNMLDEVKKVCGSPRDLHTIYRAYTFLASAYLLESAFHGYDPDAHRSSSAGLAVNPVVTRGTVASACPVDPIQGSPKFDVHHVQCLEERRVRRSLHVSGDGSPSLCPHQGEASATTAATPSCLAGTGVPTYGKARRHLPAVVAQPLVEAARCLGQAPFLDYHFAYSLGNYTLKDPQAPPERLLHWSNLGMACKFSGASDECGFIMVHVAMNAKSSALLTQLWAAVDHAREARLASTDGDREVALVGLRKALHAYVLVMREINTIRREMWNASRPGHYNDFRVFIMGIEGNEDIFGDGVVYEGCFDDEPQRYRGQTGAQDDLVPVSDILSGVTEFYPDNELTRYLMDLRRYRPIVVQRFFDDLRANMPAFHQVVKGDAEATIHLAALVEQIYVFRNGHWQFVQAYIMANTKYAKATGGTPIVSWLPNQIDASLRYMDTLLASVDGRRDSLSPACGRLLQRMLEAQPARHRILQQQLAELAVPEWSAAKVYAANADVLDSDAEATLDSLAVVQ